MKKYNPFKMWGSYVGGLVTLLTSVNLGILGGKLNLGLAFYELLGFNTFNLLRLPAYAIPLIWILAILPGFLIGWGIHSLFRKLSRRKR